MQRLPRSLMAASCDKSVLSPALTSIYHIVMYRGQWMLRVKTVQDEGLIGAPCPIQRNHSLPALASNTVLLVRQTGVLQVVWS